MLPEFDMSSSTVIALHPNASLADLFLLASSTAGESSTPAVVSMLPLDLPSDHPAIGEEGQERELHGQADPSPSFGDLGVSWPMILTPA